MREAGVLAERDVVRQIAFELVAEHFLLALELVEVRFAGEEAGRNAAERPVGHGADIGQEIARRGSRYTTPSARIVSVVSTSGFQVTDGAMK